MPSFPRLLTSLIFILLSATLLAQINPQQPMPVDQKVKIGKLSNGLTYYMRHNAQPEKHVNLHIVVTTGAVLEEAAVAARAHDKAHSDVNGTTAQYALTGVSGPSGITTNNPPNGAGTVWQITRNTTYNASSPCVAQGKCTVGQRVNANISEASLNVPLVAPMTEYGDCINQLDVNVTKNIRVGRLSIQPKLDIFNALNVAPVFSVRSLLFGTAAYNQPGSVLNPRTLQLGAVLRF